MSTSGLIEIRLGKFPTAQAAVGREGADWCLKSVVGDGRVGKPGWRKGEWGCRPRARRGQQAQG